MGSDSCSGSCSYEYLMEHLFKQQRHICDI